MFGYLYSTLKTTTVVQSTVQEYNTTNKLQIKHNT